MRLALAVRSPSRDHGRIVDLRPTRGLSRAPTVAVGIGVVFGLLVRLGDAGHGVVPWVSNIGGPWVVLAFGVGWFARRRARIIGVACLVAAVLAKYGLQLAQGDIAPGALGVRLAAWGTAAVVIGAGFGVAGAHAREGRLWPWLALAAVLGIESAALMSGVIDGESAELRYRGQDAATLVFGAEAAAACLACLLALAAYRTTRNAPRAGHAPSAPRD